MPLKFSYLCDLLGDLEALEKLPAPLTKREKFVRYADTLTRWFNKHRPVVESPDTDLAALLSCLLPERRSDRVYGMQHERLGNVISAALGLGTAGVTRLKTVLDGAEFAKTVADMVEERTGGMSSSLAVEEVDSTLNQLAAVCRFSSPKIRQAKDLQGPRHQRDILQPVLRRCTGNETKWVLRIIFKRLGPLCLDERTVLRHVHPMLPAIMKVHSDFAAALNVLRKPELSIYKPSDTVLSNLPPEVLHTCLKPQTGVKVGRPDFLKVRSLKHCLKLVGMDDWHVMPKYDGEYCQVHIERTNDSDRIQLFSKSGKDSTNDRIGLHHVIKSCLGLGEKPRFKKRCILEGEMVVFDTRDSSILPFYKIRKHVSRSGYFLGTTQDSPAHAHERLGLVLYDLLLVDDDPIMHQPFKVRLDRLRHLVHEVPCEMLTASMSTIPFAKLQHNPERAERHMIRLFSKVKAQRHEGLVLKPEQGSYLSLLPSKKGHHDGQVIKIKTDYIAWLGDTADFAVVGASYKDNHGMNLAALNGMIWTHFTIACLVNKEDMLRYEAKPVLKTMDILSDGFIPERDKVHMSQHGKFVARDAGEFEQVSFDLRYTSAAHKSKVLFKKPFVVEVLGGSFDRPPSTKHYMLRHARIRKVQMDRGLEDVISFDELQDLAEHAVKVPENEKHEEKRWAELLRQASKTKRREYVTRRSPNSAPSTSTSTRTSLPSCGKARSLTCTSTDVSPLSRISSARLPSSAPLSPTIRRKQAVSPCTLIRIDSDEMRDGDSHFVATSTLPEPRKRRQEDDLLGRATKRLDSRPFANAENKRKKAREAPKDQRTTSSDCGLTSALVDISNGSRPRSLASSVNNNDKAQRQTTRTVFDSPNMSTSQSRSTDREDLERRPDFYEVPRQLRLASPFTNYSILLAPCVQESPLVTDDLLRLFRPARIQDALIHWSREIQPDAPPLGPMVPESQADPDLQKAVLVEPARSGEYYDLLGQALEIRLMPTERIEIWDWRVLEELVRLNFFEEGAIAWDTVKSKLGAFVPGSIRPATYAEVAQAPQLSTRKGIGPVSKALMRLGGFLGAGANQQVEGLPDVLNVLDRSKDITNAVVDVLRSPPQS